MCVCCFVIFLHFARLRVEERYYDITILRSYDIRYVHRITDKIKPIIELKANDKETANFNSLFGRFLSLDLSVYCVRLYVAENSNKSSTAHPGRETLNVFEWKPKK